MSSMTLADAQRELASWRQALAKLRVASSYTYSHGETSRTLTRADIREIRNTINELQEYCNQLEAAANGDPRGGTFAIGTKNWG